MAQGTPLSEEQINELNEIAKLPVEEQQQKLGVFLKKLNPEQLEFLKKQQGGCPFCMIGEGKIEAKKVYEDDSLMGVLDIKPANKGHVVLFPKKHYSVTGQMTDEEVNWMFNVANKLGGVVFEGMKAEGTNIILSQGGAAGQAVSHVVVHIIPRWKDDKVQINWEGAAVDENELNEIQQNLSKLAGEMNLDYNNEH